MTHEELAARIERAGLVLRDAPLACPGTYELDLYCKYGNPAHGWDEFPHSICEYQTYSEAARHARKKGWIIHRDRTATCPKCAAALRARSAS